MSKLIVVRQALESNPDVLIVGITPVDYLEPRGLGPGGHYYPKTRGSYRDTFDEWIKSQIYRIVVAPRNGLYTKEELQNFMLGLVTKVEPLYRRDFDYSRDGINLGRLVFDEEIAKETRLVKRRVELTDEDLTPSGFTDGHWEGNVTEEIVHTREIDVRPYPNKTFAEKNRDKKYDLHERIWWENLSEFVGDLNKYLKRAIQDEWLLNSIKGELKRRKS